MRLLLPCAALIVAVMASAAPMQGDANPPPQPAAPSKGQEPSLRIGTITLPPYSYANPGREPFGPAVWLAREVARSLGRQPEWTAYDSIEGICGALRSGAIDIAATGLPIVEQGSEPFLYSQPWDSSGFSVAVHLRPHGRVASTLRHIVSGELLMWFGVLLGSTLCFGLLVAYLERRRNSEHFGGIRGIGEGVWWSIVTMATVGYGDRVPRTVAGRVVAGAWMITALVLVTIIAGVLSSGLTTSRLASYMAMERDLRSSRVGILRQRAGIDMARTLGVSPVTYDTPTAALAALEAHEIDALMYPTRALHSLVRTSGDPSLTVLHEEIARGFVAFGIAPSMPAPMLQQVNNAIVRAISTPEWAIQIRELGGGEDAPQ